MIYVLVCTAGEYEDKYCFNVAASTNKEKIEALKHKKEEDVEKLIAFKEKLQEFFHDYISKYDFEDFKVQRFTKKQLEDPALKKKKKLITEISRLENILKNNNSILSSNEFKYNSTDTLNKIGEKTIELVELKSKIAEANLPINHKIFLIAEMKGQIQLLRSVPTTEGTVNERYNGGSSVYHVQLTEVQLTEMIEKLESQIDTLQDEIDQYNHKTTI
jgi:chaperonin cofactor prefoldin